MLKQEAQVRKEVKGKFDRRKYDEACGIVTEWPCRISLGSVAARELVENLIAVGEYMEVLEGWRHAYGFEVEYENRRASGIRRIPTHVVIPEMRAMLKFLGSRHAAEFQTLTARALLLFDAFPNLPPEDAAKVIRKARDWKPVDFELLVSASLWFARNDATGLTPREVPLRGFSGKWLNELTRQELVKALAGKDSLGLIERPRSFSVAYLDEGHLSEEGRRYDSYVEGDVQALAYVPRFVIIVENKDTALHFPCVEKGICVFGSGRAGASFLAEIDWIAEAEELCYWGDIDADGLEILNSYRSCGLDARSFLMDRDTFQKYHEYGTNHSTSKKPLSEHKRAKVPHLTEEEAGLYFDLTSSDWTRYRRLEQEKIPLIDVAETLRLR